MSSLQAPAQVRPIVLADVPAAVALVRSVLAEFGLQFGEGSTTDDELAALPGSYAGRGGAFWVAIGADGSLVGTCGVFPVAEGTFELRKMYLDPAARGTGLGRRMLDLAVRWCRGEGATRLVLDTTERMQRAIEFYERSGFVRDDAHIRGSRCSRGYVRSL